MLEPTQPIDIAGKIEVTYDLMKESNWSPPGGYNFDIGRKSVNTVIAFRNVADESFRRKRYFNQARAAYTTSLSFADIGSSEEAITLARRSELLYHLKKYVPCLLDVNRALQIEECPQGIAADLRIRRRYCIMKIDEENHKKIRISERPGYNESFASMYPVYGGIFVPYEPEEDEIEPQHFDLSPDPILKVMVSFDSTWGRHLVATKDIEPGEIISIEEYFSMALHPEKSLENCSYCLVRCDALIPCHTCVYDLYCSQNCREKAFNLYHKFECKLLPYYLKVVKPSDCSLTLAVRTFLIGTRQGAELENLMGNPNYQNLFSGQLKTLQELGNDDYAIICNVDTKPSAITAHDILECTRLICVLRKLSFFENFSTSGSDDNEYSENLTEVEMFATKLLVKHLAGRKCNSFGVIECLNPSPFLPTSPSYTVGEGMTKFHTFVNHSCDPNTAEMTRRRNHVLYALRPIQTGDQIFISYGYCYFDETLPVRKEEHLEFEFQCTCPPCINNWPILKQLKLEPFRGRYRTENADTIAEIEKKSELLWNQFHSSSGNAVLRSWRTVSDYCKDVHTYITKPSLIIVKCENFIEECMRCLSNFYIDSLKELDEEIIRRQFPSSRHRRSSAIS